MKSSLGRGEQRRGEEINSVVVGLRPTGWSNY